MSSCARYEDGLIYRGKRACVNWDPVLPTALSDLEVMSHEEQGSLWHFRYPIEGSATPSIRSKAATNTSSWPPRPETMIGDTAGGRAIPEDERYKHLIGKKIRLPLDEPLDPHHRRRLRRSGVRLRLRQDHPGPRLQRLPDRRAPLAAADQHLRRQRRAQR